ncbi:MAG: hypothetical protein RR310_08910 [Eubacterium sp.]
MDIRERIRLIRKDQGLKQKDFGEKLVQESIHSLSGYLCTILI